MWAEWKNRPLQPDRGSSTGSASMSTRGTRASCQVCARPAQLALAEPGGRGSPLRNVGHAAGAARCTNSRCARQTSAAWTTRNASHAVVADRRRLCGAGGGYCVDGPTSAKGLGS